MRYVILTIAVLIYLYNLIGMLIFLRKLLNNDFLTNAIVFDMLFHKYPVTILFTALILGITFAASILYYW